MTVLFQKIANLDLNKCAYINSHHIHCLQKLQKKKWVNHNKRHKSVTLRTLKPLFARMRTDVRIPARHHFTLIPKNIQVKEIMKYVAVLIIAALFILSLLRVRNGNKNAFPKLIHACLSALVHITAVT
jgi:hypothetical protein